MDQSPKAGIQPLPLGQPVQSASSEPSTTSELSRPSLDTQVDKWLDAHPDNKAFSESTSPEKPAVPPGGETPPATAPTTPPTEPPKVEAPPTTAPTTEPPAAAPQAQAPPAPERPAPAIEEPVRFSLDKKYTFAEGAQPWTGQQVVDGLRERAALIPKAQEADLYRKVFEMPAAQAEQLWSPNIAWLRQNPMSVDMIGSMIADPLKTSYLLQCSQYWDSPEGQQLRAQAIQQQQQPNYNAPGQTATGNYNAPAQPAVSPEAARIQAELDARVKALEAQNQQMRQAAANQRVAREMNIAFERHKWLRDNPSVVNYLLQRAWTLNAGDDSEDAKGVLDVLEEDKDLFSKLAVLDQAAQIARAAPTPEVPPLLGSAGAAPEATPVRNTAQPKKFANLDDAVDEWYSNPPAQFR